MVNEFEVVVCHEEESDCGGLVWQVVTLVDEATPAVVGNDGEISVCDFVIADFSGGVEIEFSEFESDCSVKFFRRFHDKSFREF